MSCTMLTSYPCTKPAAPSCALSLICDRHIHCSPAALLTVYFLQSWYYTSVSYKPHHPARLLTAHASLKSAIQSFSSSHGMSQEITTSWQREIPRTLGKPVQNNKSRFHVRNSTISEPAASWEELHTPQGINLYDYIGVGMMNKTDSEILVITLFE